MPLRQFIIFSMCRHIFSFCYLYIFQSAVTTNYFLKFVPIVVTISVSYYFSKCCYDNVFQESCFQCATMTIFLESIFFKLSLRQVVYFVWTFFKVMLRQTILKKCFLALDANVNDDRDSSKFSNSSLDNLFSF